MATTGMVFTFDPNVSNGTPVVQSFPDAGSGNESNAETPFPAEWMICVTGVPQGTSPATVAALLVSSPVAIPLPFGSRRWKVAYGSLGSAITASVYN